MSKDPETTSRRGRIRSALDWAFRDTETGRVTVAQFPNWSLAIFLVASLVRRLVELTGTPRALLDAAATVSLAWWGIDEMVRGVNPWRRFLGATVLGVLVVWRVVR